MMKKKSFDVPWCMTGSSEGDILRQGQWLNDAIRHPAPCLFLSAFALCWLSFSCYKVAATAPGIASISTAAGGGEG